MQPEGAKYDDEDIARLEKSFALVGGLRCVNDGVGELGRGLVFERQM